MYCKKLIFIVYLKKINVARKIRIVATFRERSEFRAGEEHLNASWFGGRRGKKKGDEERRKGGREEGSRNYFSLAVLAPTRF